MLNLSELLGFRLLTWASKAFAPFCAVSKSLGKFMFTLEAIITSILTYVLVEVRAINVQDIELL